jgi:hypothetical protein
MQSRMIQRTLLQGYKKDVPSSSFEGSGRAHPRSGTAGLASGYDVLPFDVHRRVQEVDIRRFQVGTTTKLGSHHGRLGKEQGPRPTL